MGLTISVYRAGGRVARDAGYSATDRVDNLTLVNVDGPFDPRDTHPAALLVPGNLPGTVKIVMAEKVGAGYQQIAPSNATGPMFGGNYGGCSDSRFSEAVEKLLGHRFYGAVPIHDRYEY